MKLRAIRSAAPRVRAPAVVFNVCNGCLECLVPEIGDRCEVCQALDDAPPPPPPWSLCWDGDDGLAGEAVAS